MPAGAVATFDLGGRWPRDRPGLLLAHATGFHGLVWRPLAGHLGNAFHCYAFDQRGHGDTPQGREGIVGWSGFADDVLNVVDSLGLVQPYGVGHSGGATALLLAEATRPGTFRALYCYEPVAFPANGGPAGPGGRLAEGARRRRSVFPSRQAAYDSFASKPPLAALAPDALRAYVDHGFSEDTDGTVRLKCQPEDEASVYELGPGHAAWDRLLEISCPVTVATGDAQGSFGPEATALQVDRLPHGHFEVLTGLGHFGPLQDPAGVAASIRRAFLT